jgi:hypothetical protein
MEDNYDWLSGKEAKQKKLGVACFKIIEQFSGSTYEMGNKPHSAYLTSGQRIKPCTSSQGAEDLITALPNSGLSVVSFDTRIASAASGGH